MHKKTYITELSVLATTGFSIYQGYQHGMIRPDLIGQLIVNVYDVAMIAIPAVILLARSAYKKWFRKPVKKTYLSDFTVTIPNSCKSVTIHTEGGGGGGKAVIDTATGDSIYIAGSGSSEKE